MSLFDLILLIAIGGFGLFGLWFGLLHTLGSLIGTVLGVYIASRYYEPVAHWLVETTGWGENLSNVIIFTIAFLLINRAVGFAFWMVNKFFSIITKLPFIASLNRMLGLVFGLLEGLITVGFVLYFMDKFPFSETITAAMNESTVVPHALGIIYVLLPLVPEGVRVLRGAMESVTDFVTQ